MISVFELCGTVSKTRAIAYAILTGVLRRGREG